MIEVLLVRIVFGVTFPINLANVVNTHLNASVVSCVVRTPVKTTDWK
jgi:hypothetical protein